MALNFNQASTKKEIKEIYNYNIDAFSDSPDFNWTLDEIIKEVDDGWLLWGVSLDNEVIAACFYKKEGTTLLTKNTAIKMTYQGSGYSHMIKEFFEEQAISLKSKTITHYCSIDDFRMYSLNESHGYEKTKSERGKLVIEWIKKL